MKIYGIIRIGIALGTIGLGVAGYWLLVAAQVVL